MIIQGNVNNADMDSNPVNDQKTDTQVVESGEPNEVENEGKADYFTFTYKNGTIDFNSSLNFDSKRFIEDVKKTLRNIKLPNESHKFKLFICQAFKIPMDDLTVNQSDEKFTNTVGDYLSEFDKANLDADVGYNGSTSVTSEYDDLEQDGFDE